MSLQATYLQDLRVQYPSRLDRDELRMTQTGLLAMALSMTSSPQSIVSPELIELARQSAGRQLDVPVMQKGNVTIKNQRTCVVDCEQSQSGFVTVNFKTIVADLCMVPSQYKKNEIKYLQDLNRKITDIVEKFLIEIENDLDTALDANKSQVYNSTLIGTKYALTAGAIQVPTAEQKLFFNDIEAINYSDDFNSTVVKFAASPAMMPTVSFYVNQGSGNSENISFSFAGKDFTFSNRVTDAPGVLSTAYFAPEGSIGLVTRVDPDAMDENEATDGTKWFEDRLPGMPFNVGIKYSSKCADNSVIETAGLEHLTASMIEHWQISFDFATIVPYNSDLATKPSSIRKVEFVA